jgi:nucleotide-binding universal stress UspA family protein
VPERPDDWDDPVVIPELTVSFDTILVPFDGSHAAESALAHADRVAVATGGEIVVVVAYDPPITVRRRGILEVEHERSAQEAEATELAQESAAILLDRGRRARAVVVRGDPASAILETADAESADLVVMGRRGLGTEVNAGLPFLRDLRQGSVAEKVARHAVVPVLLVG